MPILILLLLMVGAAHAQTVPNIREVTCPNNPGGGTGLRVPGPGVGDLRRVVLTASNAVCNDGTPAIMYVRAARPGATEPDGPAANRWMIHFEGGGECSSFEECAVRWCGAGFYTAHQMSSTYEPDASNRGGLLRRNASNQLGDRNVVLLNYCSSDSWAGQKSDVVLRSTEDPTKAYSVHFRGADITRAAIAALEQGVAGMPRLTEATDVLIGGDSAGAGAVRTHLDAIAARLKGSNPNVRVRGQMESTFFPDLNGKSGFPAGDPRDPVFARKSETYNRVDVGLLNAAQDESCRLAHPGPPAYLCSDSGYLELNHITTPFFQIQDITDPQMMEAFAAGGAVFTPVAWAQRITDQMGELANIRNTAVERSAITAAPATVTRNCGIHVTWGEDDGFFGRKIRSAPGQTAYSYYELLWNWMNGASPSSLLVPRPPNTPEIPVTDSICNATAPNAPPPPELATVSSASYALGGAVAPDSIVTTFGANLAAATANATSVPWPTTLGGIQVVVTDSRNAARSAPILYVSPTQVSFLIPTGTAEGTAQIAIGAKRGTVEVAATAPALFSANATGRGVAAASYVRVTSRNERTEGLLHDPITKVDTGVPAAAGDQIFLILYGTGMRGGPATATVGEVSVPVAGPFTQPSVFPGLDQLNLGPLPLRIGLGRVNTK